ncbi:MAG: ribosome maturation factor RimM [Alphaproteobacteria bacterium]|jgi:16S rRNA processing protein RimM|nr:ribosome maturation factor RimM [Alphaproteobacteria bacterium]
MEVPAKKSKVLLAQIVATKGLQGELKLKVFTEYPLSILDYELFTDKNIPLKIIKGYIHKNVVVVKILGVTTIEEAQDLIGSQIFTNRESMPDTEEETFYYVDLIGLKVLNSKNDQIGSILAINNYGAGDFLEIKKLDGSTEAILFTKQNVPTVAIKDGYIKINDINYVDLEDSESSNNS